mgnify:CR=1 FL=1
MRSDIRDLETDLLYLRKGAGVTPGRLGTVGTLRLVLGGHDVPDAVLRQRLESAIGSLHDEDAELLLDVFALSPGTAGLSTLKQRRAHYGSRIGRGVDTVAGREAGAIANLRNQLLTGWYPASPVPGGRVPEAHNSVVQEKVEVLTVVEDRHWQQTREHYRFLALFDEADYIRVSNSFPGVVVPEPPFTVRSRRIGDSYSHDFYTPRPMRRGRTYDLRCTIRPDPDLSEDGRIVESSRAFHERTLTAAFEVMFIGEKPKTIWSFEGLTYFERPSRPTGANRIDSEDSSRIKTVFRDLYGGLFSGISWSYILN